MRTDLKPEPLKQEEGFLVVDNSSYNLTGQIHFFPTKKEAETCVREKLEGEMNESPPSTNERPFFIIQATRFKKKEL